MYETEGGETLLNIKDRLAHAWNAFTDKNYSMNNAHQESYGSRPDKLYFHAGATRSIVSTIYNQLAIDAATISIHHVRMDEDGRYISTINSGLNECLNVSANKDQTGRAFLQDVYLTMFDLGTVAIVPVDTTLDPKQTNSFDIKSMRAGEIIKWYPDQVTVRLYNDNTGKKEDVTLPKSMVAIVQNPLYAVMNEPNSVAQRLIRKLSLLDMTDDRNASGKLDVIIQLPYVVKNDTRMKQAEDRRKQVEMQLAGSKYGIAYIDGTEKVTQLNRAVENNIQKSVEYFTTMLYNQLGLTQTIFDGTATEQTMQTYYTRTIEPIISSVIDEMKRKFLSKTARTQNQSIMFFRDPFKLVPVVQFADIADKMTRNCIMTSNELRQKIGLKPVDDENANKLINSNLNQQSTDNEDDADFDDGSYDYYEEDDANEY